MNVTQQLRRISANTPPELARKLMKQTVDRSMEETIQNIINDRNTPIATKEKLRGLLETGAFRRESTEVDPDVAKQIEAYTDYQVRKMRKSGDLPDPMTDKYFRERMKRIQR